uniref:Uncharacterized protein n=2 Tax=Opuntia streptacantha TaxID=393608 RepID=A0A7C9DVW2_OPUST
MEGSDQMVLPIKKRCHILASSPPKTQESLQCHIPVFTSFSASSDSINSAHLPNPRPSKQLCTENRNLEFKTQKETTDYLWGLFDYIRADFSVESGDENQIRVLGALPIEKRFDVIGRKAGVENRNKKKPWWKSMVARGRDKLRREKMRLQKANVKNLLCQFWNREEESQWMIEHKQDPYAFLSLPLSRPLRV